jgi:hypothetical protein
MIDPQMQFTPADAACWAADGKPSLLTAEGLDWLARLRGRGISRTRFLIPETKEKTTTMRKHEIMRIHRLQSLAVKVLRAVHSWSGRQYRRELLREALWRISREMTAERGRANGGQAEACTTNGERQKESGIHLSQTRHLTAF